MTISLSLLPLIRARTLEMKQQTSPGTYMDRRVQGSPALFKQGCSWAQMDA